MAEQSLARVPAVRAHAGLIRLACLSLCLSVPATSAPAQIITTVAGGAVLAGDAATFVLGSPQAVAPDSEGNLYVATNRWVVRVDRATGAVSHFAGAQPGYYAVDGAPATESFLSGVQSMVVASNGDVYIAQSSVWKVDAETGMMSLFAGGGGLATSGDGGPAKDAGMAANDMALDDEGNLYIADAYNYRVRRVDAATGIVTTLAGTGAKGGIGDGGLATSAQLCSPTGVGYWRGHGILIADLCNFRVRLVNDSGIISTVAGTGAYGSSGDGGPATGAQVIPWDVEGGATGEFYVADSTSARVRRVDSTGTIQAVAGGGATLGDGGPAVAAALGRPRRIVLDPLGNLYVADDVAGRVRRIALHEGTISTSLGGVDDDGRFATAARVEPSDVAVIPGGHLYVAERFTIRRVDAGTGIITTIAGRRDRMCGPTGDGGAATAAALCEVQAIATDAAGNLYIGELARVRRVDVQSGLITTVAGTGATGADGDGGPATSARFLLSSIAVNAAGDLFIADGSNHRIRRVDHLTGVITTCAGTGIAGSSGDGGPATAATITTPWDLAVDGAGNLYVSDPNAYRVRRIAAGTGIITTVAGDGTFGASGDGEVATHAHMVPGAITIDATGNLLVMDLWRLRRVNASTGVLTTIVAASDANWGHEGDGGPAIDGWIGSVGRGLVTSGDDVYVGDAGRGRVRRIGAFGIGPTEWIAPAYASTTTVRVGKVSSVAWTAVSSAAWLTLSRAGGSGSGTVDVTAAPNLSAAVRVGTLTIAGQVVTVTQMVNTSGLSFDRTSLSFGAVANATGFTAQTAPQTVNVRYPMPTSTAWHVTTSAPWLQVTPAHGHRWGAVSVSVVPTEGLPTQGVVTASLTLQSEGTPVAAIDVRLTIASSSSARPIGTIDTPLDGATHVVGAVPVTGWAIDDIEVSSVSICRAPVTGERPPVDARCGNTAKVYVGDATFIEGARPDVAAAYPAYPLASRAGWGFMVLTNMLPNVALHRPAGGVGTFTFTVYAKDRDGHTTTLGTRRITCGNASSTLPFGTLDTPASGAMISGADYANFGWVLTPQPKTIPLDGSTINVYVDGVLLGHPAYGYPRADIQSLFPGYANTDTAVGLRLIDTRTLADGLHTIAWSVCDSANACTGIGSRFFTTANGPVLFDPGLTATRVAVADALPAETWPIEGQRGWDVEAGAAPLDLSASGRTLVRAEELDRIELRLGPQAGETVTGFLRVGRALSPLPAGARLDPMTGIFTWTPGAGFVGRYDLVFVRSIGGAPIGRREVRITLAPKGAADARPRVISR